MKKRLLPISIVCLLGLVGGLSSCGDSTSSPSVSLTDTVYSSVAISNKEDLKAEWHAGEGDRKVAFTISPEANVNSLISSGKLTVKSSNTSIVSVSGSMLSAVGVGSSTITVTLGSLTDTVEIAISEYVAMNDSEKTIAELATIIAAQEDKTIYTKDIYTVTGIVVNPVNSQYGNFDLYDESGENLLTVYGASTTESCIAFTSGTKQDGTKVNTSAAFTNPKDFKYDETVKEGDRVTMRVLTERYGTKNEVFGWIKTVNARDTDAYKIYSSSVVDSTNGSAVVNKTSSLYFGETVTVTCTPDDGYKVKSVTVGADKREAAVSGDNANVYTFPAEFDNVVTVEFEAAAEATSTKITGTKLGLKGEYADGTGKIDGVSYEYKQVYLGNNGMQFRNKASEGKALSSIYNTTAFAKSIASVVVTYNAEKNTYSNANVLTVTFGNESKGALCTKTVSVEKGTADYTVTPDVDTYTYVTFTQGSTYTYTAYWDSFVVNYKA